MSSSRDFGFITLRGIQAYQPNGARVPQNYLLATAADGVGNFTNNVCVSSINVSSAVIETISARTIINVSTIDVSTIYASTIDTELLNVSTIDVSTINVSNIISTNTINMNNGSINNSGGLTINSSTIRYISQHPTNTNTFKIALSGANLQTYKSTIGIVPATFLQNDGGGQLVLGTSTPSIFINGVLNTNPGYVGINTPTPGAELDVNGTMLLTSSNTTLSRFTYQFGDSFIESANTLNFTNIGAVSTAMVVQPNLKRVGINTTNPQYTLDVNGDIRAPNISTNTLILLDNHLSTCELTNTGTDLLINGFPVITEGNISSISSLYWDANSITGIIYNKNTGTGVTKYQVGVGTGNTTLNATLDVLYTGTGPGNVFNLKNSGGNLLTVNNNGVTLINGGLNVFGATTLNNNTEIYSSLSIVGNTPAASELVLHNGNSRLGTTNPYGGLFLQAQSPESIIFSNIGATTGLYASIGENNSNFNGSMTVASTLDVNGTIVLTSSNTTLSRFTYDGGNSFIESASTLNFTSINAISTAMVVQPDLKRVGINTNTPQETLDVNGTILIKGPNNGAARLIMGASPGTNNYDYCSAIEANNNSINNYGSDLRFFTHSTGISEGPTQERMRINNVGNVGINTTNPQETLDVNGSIVVTSSNTIISRFATESGNNYIQSLNSFLFTAIGTSAPYATIGPGGIGTSAIQTMSTLDFANGTGKISGLSTINGLAYPPIDDALWSKSGNNIYNDNTGGNVGINTQTPQYTLDVAGKIFASTGFITGNTQYLDGPAILFGTGINSTMISYSFENDFDTVKIAPVGNSRSQIKFNVDTVGGNPATTQMILSHDGHLGIGTTTPGAKLDVNGDAIISGTLSLPNISTTTLTVGGNTIINGNLNVTGTILNNTLLSTITITTTDPIPKTISQLINNPLITGSVRVNILAVGGGGGGGYSRQDGNPFFGGGGGGSGQEVTGIYYVPVTTNLSFLIGAGGTGGVNTPATDATNGTNTIVTSNNSKINIYAAFGMANQVPDYGGNGYYGGGVGGGIGGTGGVIVGGNPGYSYIYNIRSGENRFPTSPEPQYVNGGSGDGANGPAGNGGLGSEILGVVGGGGGGVSILSESGSGQGGDGNNINGLNGSNGGGGGGGARTIAAFGNGGNGGSGAVQIQIFSL